MIAVPVYSGKHIVRGDFLIFSSNKSFLFKNRIIDVSVNHLLLQIESNSFSDSCIRFCASKANRKHVLSVNQNEIPHQRT